MMASKKQPTQKRDPGKPPAVANRGYPDDPAWYLWRGAMAFRDTAERDPDQRVEADAMARHFDLLHTDPEYRSAALAGVAKRLDGNPDHAPVQLPRRQAIDFERLVRLNLEHYADDTRGTTIQIVSGVGMYPLILGDVPTPKLTEDLIDETEREITHVVEYTETNTPADLQARAVRVARAVLRVVYRHAGVEKQAARTRASRLYPTPKKVPA